MAKNMTPEGRTACQKAGREHIGALLDARRNALPATRRASEEFERDLLAELGGSPTPAQRALVLAATASFTALLSVSSRLRGAYSFRKVALLAEWVAPLSGSLQRSLRVLGMTERDGGDDPDTPPGSALADYLAKRDAKAQQQQEEHGET